FAALSNAHMIMSSPQPFAVPAVHNGPLLKDGTDFPCQAVGGTYSAAGVSNVLPLGSSQNLAFIGQAVHGGGSCQVSITYDTAPTKNSVWKVIHSIEGGCPAKNTPGNMGESSSAVDPFTYQYPIPDDIPTGNATIAWTWLNKIGDREFYMNCAPVTLTGSSGDKANWEALPDMLVANIGNGCTTQEQFDYKYQNPGKSVDNFASSELRFPVGNCGATAPSTGGSSGGSAGGASGGSSGGSASAAPKPTTTRLGGIFITVATSAKSTPTAAPVVSNPVASAAPAQSTAASAPAPAPVASTPNTSSPESGSSGSGSGASSGAQAAGSACSTEGQWNCIGGTSYQQCGAGTWTPVMPLAAGTKCSPGISAAISIQSAGKKRRAAVRFRG
ncbi:hypothetical protein B0T17DRAFT_470722, partial [Bombardia bombarda]